MLLVFKRSTQNSVESMVRYLSGPMVHVDMIPLLARPAATSPPAPPPLMGDQTGTDGEIAAAAAGKSPETQTQPPAPPPSAYTSYMFERFSKNSIQGEYSPETHTALYAHLTEEQVRRAKEYLERCVERSVPYNYTDVVHCVVPGSSLVLADVAPTDAPPPTLFCSQAAVLCLRHALEGATDPSPLADALRNLNSRVTTPSTLFKALKGCTDEIDLDHEDAAAAAEPGPFVGVVPSGHI